MAENDKLVNELNIEINFGIELQEIGFDPNPYIQRMRALSSELVQAYFSTCYCFNIGGKRLTLRAGTTSDGLEQYLAQNNYDCWTFISASNPYSEMLSDQQNLSRHQLLVHMLKELDYVYFEGEGISNTGSWREPCLFVPGLRSIVGESLGVLFEQNAILYGELGHTPLILFCSKS